MSRDNKMIKREFQSYIKTLKSTINTQTQLAIKAKSQKLDPKDKIETKITYSSKERIIAILNIPGLDKHLPKHLSRQENLLLLAAELAKQIVNERFVKKSREELILMALHSVIVILSQGLISVPQESIPKVTVNQKSNHLTVYFSNTIRYASGETIGLTILIADYIRSILHLNRFSTSPEIIGRYTEELEIYLAMNDRILDLNKDLIKHLIQNIGVEISGETYERLEVRKFRNLPNMKNQLRMGMCVAIDKMIDQINLITQRRLSSGIPEWDWLSPPFDLKKRRIKEIASQGIRSVQPIISKSRRPGGFRLRYGYSRNTRMGASGIHPATMYLLKILSPGSSIKIDALNQPLTVFPVSSLLGPLVELKDKSSVRIGTFSQLQEVKDDIIQIWELGDVLLSPDDIPTRETIELSAWTEEWWTGETQLAILKKSGSIDYFCLRHEISRAELERVLSEPKKHIPSSELALLLCEITKVPLHPYYSFNWNEIAISDLIKLVNDINLSGENSLSNNEDIQVILRQLGVPFIISDEKIHVERFSLFFNLLKGKLDQLASIISEKTEVIETEQLVQLITGIPIKSLCQRRIGVKVVRVEKAEPRHVTPPAHVLFPIGPYGGSQRDILKTANNPNFKIQATERFCTFCDLETFQVYCPECNQETRQRYICKNEHISFKRICEECGEYGVTSRPKPFNISNLLNSGFERTGHLELERIKGVSYLKNKNNPTPENVIKGILRSKHDIFVYKDGTARFDQTNAPLSHFTPREIHLSLTELKQLGYTHDIQGNDIIDQDQIIELFPYDIIISKTGGDFLVQLSNFIDDELVCLYNLSPYYRINSIKNLTGSLIVGLSPFSTVAIIGRVIGYTENDILYAHPFWHQLKTRNCNGDIDSMTLLLDVLINFSFEFIPVSRGGAMDIPSILYLSDEWETANNYALYDSVVTNLTFYRSLVTNPLKEDLLSYSQSYLTSKYPFVYFNDNISHHSYENLFRESKIVTKIEIILDILRLIRGIEPVEFVDGILEKDILIKITSSMDRFFLQPLRCKVCKTTFRRVPLFEKCPICHNETIGLTLSEGWVLRYFQIINQLKKKYSSNISEYSRSWIELIELNKRLIFDKGPRPTTLFIDQ